MINISIPCWSQWRDSDTSWWKSHLGRMWKI